MGLIHIKTVFFEESFYKNADKRSKILEAKDFVWRSPRASVLQHCAPVWGHARGLFFYLKKLYASDNNISGIHISLNISHFFCQNKLQQKVPHAHKQSLQNGNALSHGACARGEHKKTRPHNILHSRVSKSKLIN